MINKNLLERIVDMSAIAADDATRYTIQGVLIESTSVKKKNVVKLVATDGHMLMERIFEYDAPACPLGKFFMFQDEVKAVKLVLKECKTLDEIPADIAATGALLIGLTSKAHISKLEHEYPDYKHIVPAQPVEAVAITINAEYLLALAKVLQNGEKRASLGIRIVFDPSKPTGAVLIQNESEDAFRAVVMPVRDSGTKRISAAHVERIEELRNPKKVGAA